MDPAIGRLPEASNSCIENIQDKIGGSADVFRTVGEKWRGLEEQSREEYRKKAKEDCGNLTLQPSNSERAVKIINNMMREVAELESLRGQGMVLCTYDGMIYHGQSAVCQKLVVDKDLVKSFGSLLQLTDMEKDEVSTKDLQELFNRKYGELVRKTGQKMPYVKVKQLGIVFQGLPDTLATDIGVDPRKPQLYGSAQRRKLWLARDKWNFVISDSIISTSSTITSPQTCQISPPCSLVSSCTTRSTIVTSPSTVATSPSTIITSPSTIVKSPSAITTSPTTLVTSPSTVVTQHSTTVTSRSTIVTPHSTTVISPSSRGSQSTSIPTSSTLRVAPSSFSMASSAGCSLSSISSPSGTVVPKDTRFGMTVTDGNGAIHALCQLCLRQELHGRPVNPGNVVVQVLQVFRPGLLPFCPGGFDQDEPVCVGGYYEWPCSHLVLM